jgi:hypothetical protein
MRIDERAINEDGRIFRNPSHIDVADEADNQREIVQAIKKAQRKLQRVELKFDDKTEIKALPGTLHIREMDQEQLVGYFKSMLKCYPNIIGIHIILGKYPNTRMFDGPELNALNMNKQRFPSELAEKLAALFAKDNIIEMKYAIESLSTDNFLVKTQAAVAPDEEYKNNELFNPIIEIEFISHN